MNKKEDIDFKPSASPSEEELRLSKEASKIGGEFKLSKNQFIKLISLRYMRLDYFSEQDATECASLQWEVYEKGLHAVSQDVRDRLLNFYQRAQQNRE